MYVLGVFDDSNNDLELLKEEKKNFKKYMSQLMNEDTFKYEAYSGTKTLKELMEFIDSKKDKLTWFHFSGHHDIDGGIKIFDGDFSSLVGHLENCKKLKGVFINGCDSKSTLDKLSGKVPICIGTTKPVYDGIATEFSDMFYSKFLDVNNWKNYDDFFKAFDHTIDQIKNLSDADKIDHIDTKARGGGSLENFKLEEDFYYMAPKSREDQELFYSKELYIFNKHLTKVLINCLEEKESHSDFLKLHPNSDWDEEPNDLENAQRILADSFVWAIGEELRRLFACGKDNMSDDDSKRDIDGFIDLCGITYRLAIQLTIYLFLSALWDINKEKKIKIDKELFLGFFQAKKRIKLYELRSFYKHLLHVFIENKLELPIEEEYLGDTAIFLNNDSHFNKACDNLEKLVDKKTVSDRYGLFDCRSAEISLATIMSTFKYLARYDLFTIKKIEYEQSRYDGARYVKEINLLDKETSDPPRYLTVDDTPEMSYTVKFFNDDIEVNLFPFMMDYNALINESGTQLCFYEYLNGENGIVYWSISDGEELIVNYKAAEIIENEEISDEKQKNNLQKTIRLDLLTKQFAEAMNTILEFDKDFEFKHKVTKKPKFGRKPRR